MIISLAQAQLFFLALTRILATLIHVPVLAGPSVPNQIKIGLGLLLAMVLLPWQTLPPEMPGWTSLAFGLAIGREMIVGTIAGFAAVLVFGALQITGDLMGLGAGFSAGRIINPALESSGSAMTQFFTLTAMLIFFVVNGHHSFLLGLARTFETLPLNSPLPDLSVSNILWMTTQMIAAGVQMAMPVFGALLLTDLALGLMARVAPQVQVYFLGIPLKVGVGLLALFLALRVFAAGLVDLFGSLGERLIWMLRV
ncbi:MAG TPA: flagellar biosynthetic protein FliR [Anaerolineales bacterium]|nr:flagellar biosynthetic protein FliR [Anaerolineales bacterium]